MSASQADFDWRTSGRRLLAERQSALIIRARAFTSSWRFSSWGSWRQTCELLIVQSLSPAFGSSPFSRIARS
jgi:hypothetical protein